MHRENWQKQKVGGNIYSRCQKCGKKLTDPESRARGYGPECWGTITGHWYSRPDSKDDYTVKGQMSFEDFPELLPEGSEAIE